MDLAAFLYYHIIISQDYVRRGFNNFLATDCPLRGGAGTPLSVQKKSNWPKIGVCGDFFGNVSSVKGWGETPFSVKKFPPTFRENVVRGGSGGWGVPI